MITFNLQANNGNYYIGHEPSNHSGNCWGDESHALVLTIDQARALACAWPGYMKIVVAMKSEPLTSEQFLRELFCASGGKWYLWPHREKLTEQKACQHLAVNDLGKVKTCGACGAASNREGHWYNQETGVTLEKGLVT